MNCFWAKGAWLGLLLTTVAFLANCSGASGGGAPTVCTSTAAACQAETDNDPSKSQIRASAAYERNLSGEGVVVAVVDDGLTSELHPDLPRSRIRSLGGTYLAEDEVSADTSHGTAVTGIIAASRNGVGTHGVAPLVQVLFQSLPAADEQGEYAIADVIGAITGITAEVSFVNLSLGIPGSITAPIHTREAIEADANLSSLLAHTMQTDVAADDRVVYVVAAGNAGDADPSLFAGLPYRIPELQGHWLAVVAVNPPNTRNEEGNNVSGRLSGGSNGCGVAKDFCLAAPGVCVPTTAAPGAGDSYYPSVSESCAMLYADQELEAGYVYVSGTSFAAPQVTGALALMAQQFRDQMGNTALVARLLATANRTDGSDTGGVNYSDSDVYGQGLLDVAAATAPVDAAALVSAAGGRQSLSSIQLQGARANISGLHAAHLYRALAGSLQGQEVMLLDALDFPFWYAASEVLMGQAARIERRAAALPANSITERPIYMLGQTRAAAGVAEGAVFALGGMRTLLGARTPYRPPLPSATPASPWLQLFDGQALFAGGRSQFGASSMTLGLAHWQDRARSPTTASSESRQLLVAQYQVAAAGGEISLLSGQIEEAESLLGLGRTALLAGNLSATTRFVGIGGDWRLGRQWYLAADWQRAYTQIDTGGTGPLRQLEGLRSSFAQLTLARTGLLAASDVLSLSAVRSDPTEAGIAVWELPVALHSGQPLYSTRRIRLNQPVLHRLQMSYGSLPGSRLRLEGRLTTGYSAELFSPQQDYQLSAHLQLSF